VEPTDKENLMTAKSAEATSEEEWTSLGTCHYGGEDEEATVMAAHADGTGWIAVCDQHTGDAKKDGYAPES
jgi:hypothetical protein